jgi:hypothetical protein
MPMKLSLDKALETGSLQQEGGKAREAFLALVGARGFEPPTSRSQIAVAAKT